MSGLSGLLSMLGGQPQQPGQPTGLLGGDFSSRAHDVMAGMAMGTTPQESMSMAGRVMAVHGGQREQQQRVLAHQNQTLKFLTSKGVDPGTASYLATDPAAMRAWFGEYQKGQKPEWKLGEIYDDKGQKQKIMYDERDPSRYNPIGGSSAAHGGGEYGLNPIYGTVGGKTAVLQLGKDGKPIMPTLPEGFEIARDPLKVDGPTGTAILDPQTRQQVGFIPKDVQGAAAAHQRGESQGTAQAALPSALSNAERSLTLVDEAIKHPGRSTATGASGTFDPRNYVPGTDAKDFQVRAEQLKGRTFLEAFQSLKGGGAITEREGQAAAAAVARLNTAQSDSEYLNALNELKGIIAKGVEVLRQKAGVPSGGGGGSPVAAANATATDGWQDFGGVKIRRKQ